MQVRVVALYPRRISVLAGKPGVRFRKRRKVESTLVPCRIEARGDRSVAVPELDVPEGTPAPVFKAQLETVRVPVDERRLVCVVLSADPALWKEDPEQMLLSPIFDDGRQMIFEFRRAFVLSLTDRRELETRLVAVHSVSGTIGTKTIHRFNTRFMPLAARCMEYLAGAVDLFPPPERFVPPAFRHIPEGEANLAFEPRGRARQTTTAVDPGTVSFARINISRPATGMGTS